ncbi:MAG: pilus assembly protein [Alphaproteobacteria bacterium]|nr:pilus assembly protein [Alphaproteobacteria bacterium]
MTRKCCTLDDAGQAIVEFAFVGPILLGLLCGVFEFSGILFAQTLLEGGARQASRYGVTGTSTAGVSREDMILQIIEENSYGVIDTDEIDMETLVYESFADVGQPEPFTDANSNGIFDDGEDFEDINGNSFWDEDMGQAGLGGPGDIVVYRLRYDWTIMIPVFRPFFGDAISLDANVAVRNEPFIGG